MPAGIIHQSISKLIQSYYPEWTEEERYQFLIGNIFPDSWRNTDEFKESDLPKMKKREKSHFHMIENKHMTIEDYESFYNKYKSEISNPFVMGYYTHLMTDHFWKKSYLHYDLNKPIKLLDGSYFDYDKKEKKELLSSDMKMVSKSIRKIFSLEEYRELTKEEINSFPKIEELDFSGINETLRYENKKIKSTEEEKGEVFLVSEFLVEIYIILNQILLVLKDKDIL